MTRPRGEDSPIAAHEIEAILLAESSNLPPESHLPAPPPLVLAQRTPGTGRMGRLPVVLFLLFVLMSLWQTMK